ncbi:phage tail protein [Methylocystis parvus]|uniref:phage tail protein n=1 Tax=Methylocystis parvus TaxID=134 RepID=UPI003C78CF7D
MRKYLTVFLVLSGAASFPAPLALGQSEPFLGQIATFPYNFCPRGWAATDGQLMPISQNTALFALLGTTYGGNGQTTFALPNLKAKTTLTTGAVLVSCIALQGIFPSRN